MCLIPAVPALYDRLKAPSLASPTLGCGTLAAVIPVLAMLDIVQRRLALPVMLALHAGVAAWWGAKGCSISTGLS